MTAFQRGKGPHPHPKDRYQYFLSIFGHDAAGKAFSFALASYSFAACDETRQDLLEALEKFHARRNITSTATGSEPGPMEEPTTWRSSTPEPRPDDWHSLYAQLGTLEKGGKEL